MQAVRQPLPTSSRRLRTRIKRALHTAGQALTHFSGEHVHAVKCELKSLLQRLVQTVEPALETFAEVFSSAVQALDGVPQVGNDRGLPLHPYKDFAHLLKGFARPSTCIEGVVQTVKVLLKLLNVLESGYFDRVL